LNRRTQERTSLSRRGLAKLRNPAAALAHDLLMVPVAWLGAYWLRFNLHSIPQPFLAKAIAVLPAVLIVQGAVFWYFGLYRGVWRFASIPDFIRIAKAVFVGTCVSAAAIFLITRMQAMPRSVFPLYALLIVSCLCGPRLLYRWWKDRRRYLGAKQRVLIVGAGSAGEMLVRDLLRDPSHGYVPVAFADDDARKKGQEIQGVRVRGKCKRLPRLVRELGVQLVLLAVPAATTREMRRLVELCEQVGVPFRTLPRMQDLVSGRSVLQELREVSIEDLLGREPVSLDWDAICRGISGKSVLVTGGGGSIGSELCRQVARLGPARLVIFDQSEFSLYAIETELRERTPWFPLHALLGDVCDAALVDSVMAQYRPQIVFHAAAYKHVPMLEAQVRQAVRNNALGTRMVADAARRHSCEAFILISTDKAVNAVNVMGASKRVAELICQEAAARHPETRYITVRFGNVLDSGGSVVPRFRRQIAAGGPVTVTHPEVERYFMTIPEACQLILVAAALGKGSEVFVLDMGEPVKIAYLAEQMIALAGKTPGEDIEIVYTGLRPGEKLREELFHPSESPAGAGHQKLLLARHPRLDHEAFGKALQALLGACEGRDEAATRAALGRMVPEFGATQARRADNVVPIDAVRG
jgi:FlaA1/EpsC-like NDP-sugar epimerase